MSAEHDIIDDNERSENAEVDVVKEAEESFEQSRHRPPDLVGTRPEWDPATLVPNETPRAVAGRLWAPAGEGDTETLGADAAASATTQTVEEAAAPIEVVVPPYSRYSARFQFLFGALIAVGAAAIVLLVAVVVGGKNDTIAALPTGPPWSRWEPTTKGVLGANEIADHVGREYRVGAKQLATVTGSALELHGLPVTIAVLQTAAQGGDINILDGSGVLYRLCGVYAENCNLAGKPSRARLLLLRREALELALYSFKYLGVSKAVVILPPTGPAAVDPVTGKLTKAKTTPSRALLFRNDEPDVQAAIIHPLATTLVAKKTPTVESVSRSPDAQNVSALTIGKLFSSKFTTANQDAGFILVLDPVPLG